MKVYIYYSKFDSTQEPQGKIKADNIEQAIENAAQIKQLSIDDFLEVFIVKEI